MTASQPAVASVASNAITSWPGEADPRLLVSEIKTKWRQGLVPDARNFLERFPGIARRKSLALDLAYEEYCLREEAGDRINVPNFCRQFPSISHSLTRQIEVHQYLTEDPDVREAAERFAWPEPGEKFFQFDVIEELGRGALARAYLCGQPDVGNRQVVVKVAYQGAYEADTMGRLKHPNIVPVYSVFLDELTGSSCICMPFCGRSTLCDVLDLAFAPGKFPTVARVILQAAQRSRENTDQYDRVEEPDPRMESADYVDGVLLLGRQLADALSHAHERWIIHGDLKPSNVLVTPAGRPMLLDFNLSHDRQQPAAMTGGTLPYMAPEQIRAALLDAGSEADALDERIDIFSLGVILYELLCGQLPFGPITEPVVSKSLASRLVEAQRRGSKPLQSVNSAADADLAQFIDRCLAFDPTARPASMRQVVEALSHHMSGRRRAVRWTRSHRRAVLAGIIAFVATGGVGVAHLITRDPYEVRILRRGLHYLEQGQFGPAKDCFSEAISANQANARAYYLRGQSFLGLEEYGSASKDFRSASEHQPLAAYEACVAYCQNLLGYPVTAIVWYELALAKGFESVGLHNNLAHSYLRAKNDKTKARWHLDQAVKLGAESPIVFFNRAQVSLQELQTSRHTPADVLETALEDIERAISGYEPNAELHVVAAHLYGLASQQDPGRCDSCIAHACAAVECGFDATRLLNDPTFNSVKERLHTELLKVRAVTQTDEMQHLIYPVDAAFGQLGLPSL